MNSPKAAGLPARNPQLATRNSPSGFALIIAIILVGLVGVALLGLTGLLAADVRRTHAAVEDVQLRELLRIGAAAARQRLAQDDRPAEAIEVQLPPEQAAESTVTYSIAAQADERTARITARTSDRPPAHQVVTFRRESAGWRMHSAAMDN